MQGIRALRQDDPREFEDALVWLRTHSATIAFEADGTISTGHRPVPYNEKIVIEVEGERGAQVRCLTPYDDGAHERNVTAWFLDAVDRARAVWKAMGEE